MHWYRRDMVAKDPLNLMKMEIGEPLFAQITKKLVIKTEFNFTYLTVRVGDLFIVVINVHS